MKTKFIVVSIFTLYSAVSIGAFSEAEIGQLSAINKQSSHNVKIAQQKLQAAIARQIRNNPENRSLIEELTQSWNHTTVKKCQLETIESQGTDAQIAEVNQCLVKGYEEQAKYFNEMPP